MGRRKGEISCYYWLSKTSGEKVGWVFPSRKQAESWRNTRYYKYVEYSTLEEYLATVPASRKTKEHQVWLRHREGYMDLEMKMGVIKRVQERR